MLIIVKILISISMVLILAEIAKRVNPALSGIVSGLPLGTGMSVYFIALQEGIPFMTGGIPWGIAGLASSISFCLTYLLAGYLTAGKGRLYGIVSASALSIMVFALTGYWIQVFTFSLIPSIIFFALFFVINLYIVYRIRIIPKKVFSKKWGLGRDLLRGIIVALIILIITGLPRILGGRWAGILSSFPSTLFPLLLLLHFEHDDSLYPSVIKGFSYGITTLVVFYTGCFFILPRFGLNTGMLIVFFISVIYLVFLNTVKNRIEKKCVHPVLPG